MSKKDKTPYPMTNIDKFALAVFIICLLVGGGYELYMWLQ